MGTKNADLEHVLTRIESMLKDAWAWDERPADLPVDFDASLLSLGIDSLTLAILLDKVGKEFQIDWEVETSPCAVGSLRSIAALVVRRSSDSSADAGGEQCAPTVPS